jgi:uncharacterized protein YaiI (UPF0178 family)
MEQEPKDVTDRQIYEISIGPVCMSKTEYAMYREEMAMRIGNLHIYVDADACPVVDIVERIAEKYGIPVTLLCDTNHVLQSDYSEVIVVGAGADAVDYKLISICHKGDIVVSQDYGVAAMALGKGAYAIHQSGKWYTNDNIDQMLMERHLNKKARRASGKNHVKGPKKRTPEDDEHFSESFEKMIRMAIQNRKGEKMAKNERFERTYSQGTMNVTEIWVDKETGVNYLYHAAGYSGGLTPLLDRDGKPVISPIVNG